MDSPGSSKYDVKVIINLGTPPAISAGDTLFSICRRHGLSMAEVAAVNGIKNPHMLEAGTALTLPNSAGQSKDQNALDGIKMHLSGLKNAVGRQFQKLAGRNQEECSTSALSTMSSKGGPGAFAGGMTDTKLKELWDEIDVNKDNQLTRAELVSYGKEKFVPQQYIDTFLKEAGDETSSPTAGELLMTDRDNNNTLDFQEFKQHMNAKDQALKRAFEVVDADNNGYISVSELEAAFTVLVVEGRALGAGEHAKARIRPRAVKGLMQKLDLDGNGELDFDEFRTFFAMIPGTELEYLTPYWRASAIDCGTGFVADHQLGVKPGRNASGSPWAHLFSGGVAGGVAKSICAPLETIRVRMMVSGTNDGISKIAQTIMKESGVGGFFRGNVVNSLSAMPSKGICFLTFEWIKDLMCRGKSSLSNMELLAAGAAAGAVTEVIIHPMSFATQRMMVSTQYKSVQDCIVQSIRKEGPLSIYKGVGPSVLGIIPFSLMSYGVYDIMERKIEESTGKPVSLGTKTALGMFASWAGMAAACPLSVVRSRLMTQTIAEAAAGTVLYRGVGDAFKRIYVEEGLRAFYRGLGVASMRMIPVGGISRGTYEAMRMGIESATDAMERMQGEVELRSIVQS